MQRRLLSGTHECSLDNRFRFAIPARLREAFADGATVGWWLDDCLVVVPTATWGDVVQETFGSMSVLHREGRDLRRWIIGTAVPMDLDKQGRVALTPDHRSYAGIEGSRVRLVGVGPYLELWDPARLAARLQTVREEGVSSHAERLAARVA